VSDTAAPKSGGCARKLIVLGLLCLVLGVGAGVLAYGKAFEDQPLDFAPFSFKTLEEPALLAKFELTGNLKSWITGADTAEVALDEREFNGLLFGNANHGDDAKSRISVEGDALRVESSERRPGEPAKYLNIRALVKLNLGPDTTTVEIVEGQVGGLTVRGPLKDWLSKRISAGFQTHRQENPRLQRLKALWVKAGKVHLVYTPPE
jgi:hypothetical protein